MTIKLPEIATAPNGGLGFDYTIDLSAEEVNFERPFYSPVRISGHVSDNSGMVRLSGVIEAEVSTRCARCAKPVAYHKAVNVDFMLATTLEGEDVDDIFVIESDDIELDDIFVPELIMDMEMSVLCREDCAGLCPKCGKNLNEGQCACDRREIDPRLEKLRQLLDE